MFDWFTIKRFLSSSTKRPTPQRTLTFEVLEDRSIPSVSPWTSYVPNHGDRVDALISQLLPRTHDAIHFFENLNGWIAASIAPLKDLPRDANTALTVLHGDCTTRASIFETVALRLGIAAQTVVLTHVPHQGEHASVEIAIGGSWHFFDPTTGVYLRYRQAPNPLGLPQARKLSHVVTIMISQEPHWRGAWSHQSQFTYQPAKVDLIVWHGRKAFELKQSYERSPYTLIDAVPFD